MSARWAKAMRGRNSASGGWLLVGLIVILSSVFVAMAGVTLALGESRRTISLRENDTEAIYLAQAGVMDALYRFRSGNGVGPLGIDQRVDPGPLPGTSDDDVFILGGQMADSLLVNMKPTTFQADINLPNCSPPRRDRMQNWTIRNVLASGGMSLTIDRIRVNWSPNLGEGVLRIDLNGNNPDWTAPSCSGVPANTDIDLFPNQSIPPMASWNTNRIWFTSNGVMAGKAWIDISFIMSDGTVRTSHWDRAIPANRSADFTIKSVGEVRKGPFPFVTWRRLQAEYRLSGAAITSTGNLLAYQELTTKSP